MNDKRSTVDRFLLLGLTEIWLDARQAGVDVPDALRERALMLNVSYKFSPPDLQVTDWGVTFTASFRARGLGSHHVKVPWAALFGARSLSGELAAWAPPAGPVVELGKRRGVLGVVH